MKIIITRIFMSITIILSLVGYISASNLSSDERKLIDLSKATRAGEFFRWQFNARFKDFLDAAGINPNVRDERGLSPLYYACLRTNHGAIELLLQYGANADMLYPYKGENLTLIQIFISEDGLRMDYPSELPDVIRILVEKGKANPNVTNKNGDAPLYFAARIVRNPEPIIRSLIDHGATIDHQNKNGNTALHEAVRKNNEIAVQELVQLGASTTIKNKKGKSPIDIAIETNSPLLRYLLPKPPVLELEEEKVGG